MGLFRFWLHAPPAKKQSAEACEECIAEDYGYRVSLLHGVESAGARNAGGGARRRKASKPEWKGGLGLLFKAGGGGPPNLPRGHPPTPPPGLPHFGGGKFEANFFFGVSH